MTDASIQQSPEPGPTHCLPHGCRRAHPQTGPGGENGFSAYGIAAIATGLFFLVVLFVSILAEGHPGLHPHGCKRGFHAERGSSATEAEGELFKTQGLFQPLHRHPQDPNSTSAGLEVECRRGGDRTAAGQGRQHDPDLSTATIPTSWARRSRFDLDRVQPGRRLLQGPRDPGQHCKTAASCKKAIWIWWTR